MVSSTPGATPGRILSLIAHEESGQQIRAVPADTEAFLRGIYALIAQTPAVREKTVQLPKELVAPQQKCTTAAQQTSPIPVGQQVYVRNFMRKWKDSKFERPYPVTQVTPTAGKVEDRKPWIHLSDICLASALCQKPPLLQERVEENKEDKE
ncbi:hypothetical protein NDU88_006438 [Pleurodeles waltl]|uniref:Murine leukemia virus integrase C-terminal domain-containing protein n=1 Tax=Pleurodeles waltl TaxID=8319 RepID=A0AAV7UM45_PLEWA|nr:hypothetical protein NDU88_006438 [Pleurodeles waltl]